MRGRSLLVAASAIGIAAVAAHAADRHVPAQYPTIQSAIDAAEAGDVVLVAAGEYRGGGNRDISFDGKAITVRGVGGPSLCVIDCQGTPEKPFRGLAFTSGEGPDSVLEGFTICNGATLPGAIADIFNGAGILCANGSSPTIRDCVIRDNAAGCWGGGICCSSQSSPTIERCTIIDNHTDDDGGGVFAWNGSHPVIVDTLIARNVADVIGGGITTFNGGVSIINSTIVGNTALSGSGVWANTGTTFDNTIIWGNHGDEDVRGTPTIRYSLVAGGYDGEGNLDTVPGFVNAAAGDYRLAAQSPLVDAGDPDYLPGEGETDRDGNPRVVGAGLDVGAFELQSAPCRTDFDGSGAIDFVDLVDLLSVWGACAGCLHDVDGNGAVDFADMLETLSAWGPCP